MQELDADNVGAAWRTTVSHWLEKECIITVSVNGKVLPLF